MEIDLTCAGCPRPDRRRRPPWAAASGLSACLSWLPRDASTQTGMRLLDRPPVIGATYSLLVRHPFSGRTGTTQWALFEPAAPWRDGWSDHAGRLPELALARIEPLNFLGASRAHGSAEQQTGWLTARVEELVLAPDLRNAFPRSAGDDLGPLFSHPWPAEEVRRVEHGSLVLYERSVSEDVGMWALVHRSALQSPVLLAAGEWGFHEAGFSAGNHALTPSQARLLPGLR